MQTSDIKLWKTEHTRGCLFKGILISLSVLVLLGLTDCCRYAMAHDPYRPASDQETASKPIVSTQIFFYPINGQTAEQQDRDRYECFNWAVKESGFDPSLETVPPEYRVTVVPNPPPGHDTAVGAVAGAVIGAIAAGPRHSGEGALVGAGVGALAGVASDASRQETARRIEDAKNDQQQERYRQYEQGASAYRRAMTACLEARGYNVK